MWGVEGVTLCVANTGHFGTYLILSLLTKGEEVSYTDVHFLITWCHFENSYGAKWRSVATEL